MAAKSSDEQHESDGHFACLLSARPIGTSVLGDLNNSGGRPGLPGPSAHDQVVSEIGDGHSSDVEMQDDANLRTRRVLPQPADPFDALPDPLAKRQRSPRLHDDLTVRPHDVVLMRSAHRNVEGAVSRRVQSVRPLAFDRDPDMHRIRPSEAVELVPGRSDPDEGRAHEILRSGSPHEHILTDPTRAGTAHRCAHGRWRVIFCGSRLGGVMAITEVASTSTQRASQRLGHPGRMWILPIGLVVVVLAVAGLAMINRHTSTTGAWPQRIVVNDRTYNREAAVSAVDVRANDGAWTQVGTAGPQSYPVYAAVIPGSPPTAVIVQTSLNSYAEYALVGGP